MILLDNCCIYLGAIIFKNNDLIINFSFIKTIDQVLKYVMSILKSDVTIIVSTLNDMHRDIEYFIFIDVQNKLDEK